MKAVWSISKVLVATTLGLTGACTWGIPSGDFTFGQDDPDAGHGMPDAAGGTPDASMVDAGPPPPDARAGAPNPVQAAYVKASNTGTDDAFGWQVALWGDTMAVSARQEDSLATGVDGNQWNDDLPNSGAVYVFRYSGARWEQEAFLKASHPDDSDEFGYTLALWGDTLAVGAWGERSNDTGINGDETDNSARDAGAVYVFRRTGGIWAQEAYIKASNTGAGDEFGGSLALWENTLVVGAPEEGSSATGVDGNQLDENAPNSGAVYVFRRTGTDWVQEAYLKASNTEADDEFGVSVAIYGDTIAVGAYLEDSAATGVGGDEGDRSALDSGAVYVFRHSDSAWSQEAYVKASNTGEDDRFGWKVALWEDALAVSALREDSGAIDVGGTQNDDTAIDSGAVYVFRYDGTTWVHDGYLKASNTSPGDQFGSSLALVGNMLLAGAPLEDSPDVDENGDSGGAYLFQRTADGWNPPELIKAGVVGPKDGFGVSVAISADMFVAGVPSEDSAATDIGGNPDDNGALGSGAAYVFTY